MYSSALVVYVALCKFQRMFKDQQYIKMEEYCIECPQTCAGLPYLQRSAYAKDEVLVWPFSVCQPLGSHIPSSGRLCKPLRFVCSSTPQLHLGSFTSLRYLKCMHTQTAHPYIRKMEDKFRAYVRMCKRHSKMII